MGASISNASFPQAPTIDSLSVLLKGKTILIGQNIISNGRAILRTVTTGKTFYLVYAYLGMTATANGHIAQLDAGGDSTRLFRLISAITPTYKTNDSQTINIAFPNPIPYAAGTVISIESTNAALDADGIILGWEE